MSKYLNLGQMNIELIFKDIKNIHLSVYPPMGTVKISAPTHMSPQAIRAFAISKLDWIKRQQNKLQSQKRESPREYLERESHYLFGKRYLLGLIEKDAAPVISIKHRKLILQIRPQTSADRRAAVLDEWYRKQLKVAATAVVDKWEEAMGVKVGKIIVQRMKTKWGGCNPSTRNIRLNTELAKKPPGCLEYIVVHEMAHLLVPTHNQSFINILDRCLPNWRVYKQELNQLPLREEHWIE